MIIMKGNILDIGELTKAESILFVNDGAYSYVESGIVENELRVLGNWKIADRPFKSKPWLVLSSQGDPIPQELGDWLVAHQDLEAKVLIVKRGEFSIPESEIEVLEINPHAAMEAYRSGFISGVFECGEILSRPLPHRDDDQAPNEAEQTEDQTED